MSRTERGCIFFNYGDSHALRLLVAVFSLRRVYDGPVTVFVVPDAVGAGLRPPLEGLGCEVIDVEDVIRACDRYRLFQASPYATTLVFDSDLIFLAPVDDLWAPLEREGLLVTRFHPNPHGVDGSPAEPGWADRVGHLEQVRPLVDPETHAAAIHRLLEDGIDINLGVMGVSRPGGEPFVDDWSQRMARPGADHIPLVDEILTLALLPDHRHALVEETWNCPADEYFRRTDPADAHVIHYFADGHRVHGQRLGRNPATWTGQRWHEVHRQADRELDLHRWRRWDPTLPRPVGRRLLATGLRRSRAVARRATRRRSGRTGSGGTDAP